MADAAQIVVHTFGNQTEADIAVSALDAAGIDAIIMADTVGGTRPHVAATGRGFQVLVREEDLIEARDILDLPARPT